VDLYLHSPPLVRDVVCRGSAVDVTVAVCDFIRDTLRARHDRAGRTSGRPGFGSRLIGLRLVMIFSLSLRKRRQNKVRHGGKAPPVHGPCQWSAWNFRLIDVFNSRRPRFDSLHSQGTVLVSIDSTGPCVHVGPLQTATGANVFGVKATGA
jgi:hypothetical protein